MSLFFDQFLLEQERLDVMFNAIFSCACEGDLRAIDRCLKIMERRSKLFGLDKMDTPSTVFPMSHQPPPSKIDFSKLSVDELRILQKLVKKEVGVPQ